MTASDLLAELRGRGVALELTAEGAVVIDAPAEALSAANRAQLAERKLEVAGLLQAERRAVEAAARSYRLTGELADGLSAVGWKQPGPLEWCAVCDHGTVWIDPNGRPMHPWCAVPEVSTSTRYQP